MLAFLNSTIPAPGTRVAASDLPTAQTIREALTGMAKDPAFSRVVQGQAADRGEQLHDGACETARQLHGHWAQQSITQAVEDFYHGPPRIWGKVKSPLIEDLAHVALTSLGATAQFASPVYTGIEAALETSNTQELARILRGC